MILKGRSFGQGFTSRIQTTHKKHAQDFYLQIVPDSIVEFLKGDEAKSHFEQQFSILCKDFSFNSDQDSDSSLDKVGAQLLCTLTEKETVEPGDSQLYIFCLKLLKSFVDGAENQDKVSR